MILETIVKMIELNILYNEWKLWCNDIQPNIERIKYLITLDFNSYPSHWQYFILSILRLKHVKQIFDIGCGVGAYYLLCHKHFPHIKYHGYDKNPIMIYLAMKNWLLNRFTIISLEDIVFNKFADTDLLLTSGLTNMLENGDNGFEKVLSFNCPNVLVQRILLTDEVSFRAIHNQAQNEYLFHHNKTNIFTLINKYQYKYKINYCIQDNNYNIILTK